VRLCFILLLASVALGGCNRMQPDADPPGYTLTIPDDVPEHLVLEDKGGTKHEGNGRELYAAGHRAGWQRCWEEHQRGRLDPQDKGAAENWIPSDYRIVVRGFVDGFKACQQYIDGT
jgi:hypothetical protein